MRVLIKQAKLVAKGNPLNGKQVDILIDSGKIEQVETELSVEADQVIEYPGLHVSAGWLDMRAEFGDPGYEHREDIETGLEAAKRGGFTGVCVMPNTAPVVDTRAQVQYIKTKAALSPVELIPFGALSKGCEGGELSEMYDMYVAGAPAFTDHKKSIGHAGLLERALLYAQNFDGLICSFADDKQVSAGGHMHEGETSTLLGLKGIPSIAEEVRVNRDLYLAQYTDAKIHFSALSASGSVEQVREAKNKQLAVSSDVAAHQLNFIDEDLMEFDSLLKVIPPFRGQDDRKALIEGIVDGTIDVLVSDHCPQEIENKQLEFELATPGIIGLQTFFGSVMQALKDKLPLEDIVSKFTTNPRTILGLEQPQIEAGAEANLTLFDPDKSWVVEAESLVSKSKNSPFIGKTLTGSALGIYAKGQLFMNA